MIDNMKSTISTFKTELFGPPLPSFYKWRSEFEGQGFEMGRLHYHAKQKILEIR